MISRRLHRINANKRTPHASDVHALPPPPQGRNGNTRNTQTLKPEAPPRAGQWPPRAALLIHSIHITLTRPMCNRENRAHTSSLQLSTRNSNHEY